MSSSLFDRALSIMFNLVLWLIGATLLTYPQPGSQYWLLIGLGCALLGGLISEPVASNFVSPLAVAKRPITVVVGAIPLVALVSYLTLVQAAGNGWALWLLVFMAPIGMISIMWLMVWLQRRQAQQT